jgi:hypothetical protein
LLRFDCNIWKLGQVRPQANRDSVQRQLILVLKFSHSHLIFWTTHYPFNAFTLSTKVDINFAEDPKLPASSVFQRAP